MLVLSSWFYQDIYRRYTVNMGASVAIEMQKPVDASDIEATQNIEFAKNEVIRLRRELGHLAIQHGVEIGAALDASDLGNESIMYL